MDDDDLSFDFESKLEEQRKEAERGTKPAGLVGGIPSAAAVPVNQSAGSFQRNYRQTVCTYWLKGVCALGEKCGFLHEYNAEKMPTCRNLVKFGVCKEPDCPYKHTLDDIKECNMFKLGFCIYGPQCRYKHTRLPGPPPEPKDIDCTRLRDAKRLCQDANRADASDRSRPWGGRGRGHDGPRPPPGSPPPKPGAKRSFDEMNGPPNFGFGHGMMGMPGMMPGMVNPMQMQQMQMMGFPFWNGPGMFPFR